MPGDFNSDTFGDLRMQFENSGLGITTKTRFLRLECQAAIVVTNKDKTNSLRIRQSLPPPRLRSKIISNWIRSARGLLSFPDVR